MKQKKSKTFLVLLSFLLIQAIFAGIAGAEESPVAEVPITAADAVANMGPGWNLGNTLDAVPYEGAWNNPPVQAETFDEIKEAGFENVRIPVTWTTKIGSKEDGYPVDEVWMDRVEEVVDMALARDFYVTLNVHHDSWEWIRDNQDQDTIDKFFALWEQIADRFKDKSYKLMLEVLNEPDGENHQADHFNALNAGALEIIRASGGRNAERIVLLPSIWTDIERALETFEIPAGYEDDEYLVLTVHNYHPWDFVSNWWGRTHWSYGEDGDYFNWLFSSIVDAFNLPVILGEYGTLANNEPRSKWVYHDQFISTALKYGIATIWWDNGHEQYDRINKVWRDPVVMEVVVNAGKGIPNSLVDEAGLYFKVGEPITDREVGISLNGNSFEGAYVNGQPLVEGVDYTFANSSITLTEEYLSKTLTDFGTNETVTLQFSQGAIQQLYLILYDTPVLKQTHITINPSSFSGNLRIPTNFKGTTLATVKARKSNGDYLKDDWTQWNPEHRQGRLNMDDDFWSDNGNIYISNWIMNNLIDDGTELTFEFHPRTFIGGLDSEVLVTITFGVGEATAVISDEGSYATIDDESVYAIYQGGTLNIDLTEHEHVNEIRFTEEQVDALNFRQANVIIRKNDLELHVPFANFDGNNLSIHFEKLEAHDDTLPVSSKSSSSIYQLTMTLGGETISQFEYEIQLSFVIDESIENPEDLKVFYWNAEEQRWDEIGGAYTDGKVVASTNHFSIFTVFDPTVIPIPDDTDDGNGDDNGNDGDDNSNGDDSGDSNGSDNGDVTPIDEDTDTDTTDTDTDEEAVEEEKDDKLPETATNMFTFLLLGSLLFLVGVILAILRLRRNFSLS